MDAHTVVEEWETSPFDGGLDELARMGRRGFSGAVESGADWLFVADGDPVAVVSGFETAPTPGSVDAFEDASGRTHEAPHPAVARLAPMLALEGEVRGQYFSDDTPISTVHETLAEGGFSGYLELSENVLSGDYYVVYEDGEPTYAAYIGSTERLVTGDEAESKTKNEVGIYSVVAVDPPVPELPDAPESTGAAGAGSGVAATDAGPADESDSLGPSGDAPAPGAADDTAEDTVGTTDDGLGTADDAGPLDTGDDALGTADEPDPAAGPITSEPDPGQDGGEAASEPAAEAGGAAAGAAAETDEERTVPSLDPERTGRAGTTGADAADSDGAEPPTTGEPEPETETATEADPDTESEADSGTEQGVDADATEAAASPGADPAASSAALEEVRSELARLRQAYDRLESRVSALEADGGAATAAASSSGGAAAGAGPSLSPTEALSKTTLFVREGTRGGPTLEDAHDGRADREALAANVGLEYHTRFDDAEATVDGTPYASFLESTDAYEFVEWLTTDLLFEIRMTGTQDELRHLYDAIPAIDRVFFHESVTVDDGDESRELTFDVVVRDRNGEPLFVASLDDGREPTPGREIEALVTDASDFCSASDTVAGAFAVTASYFEPGALEVAREATTGSLLSRERYRSFVNLSRKNGFHLCLVEARDASLHLTLPEL